MLIKTLIILIPDPFNVLYLFNICEKAMLLTVFDNISGCVFPYVWNADDLFEGSGIDINFKIYSVTINKVDNVKKRRIFLKRMLQQRTGKDNTNK